MSAITTLTGTGYLFPLQSGNSGKYLTTDGSVLSWGTPSGGGGLSGSGTTNYLSKWTSGSALGNSLVYDDGTSILVNTTSTQGQKFQVNGDALVSGLLTISGATVLPAQTASHLRFGSGYSSPDIGRMYIGDGTGWKFHMSKRISSVTTDLVTFQDNGNIGIGITSTDYKLEAVGTIYASSGGFLSNSNSSIDSNLYGSGQIVSGSTSQPTLYLDTTWNTTGNPSAIDVNVNNTASGTSSKLINLKLDFVSMFSVSKSGAIKTAEPTGYTAKPWKLGDVYTGTISEDRYILVEIDGNIYSIAAMAGTP
jgi:hypothetical protein